MNKIIYIAGIGHCGSTILDMSLGCHPSIIGLGEVINLLLAKKEDFSKEKFTQVLCSCGQNMDVCEFWSGAKNILLTNSKKTIEAKFQSLNHHFNKKFGNDKILVDSSKNLTNILNFYHKNYKLYVIFLIRDVRSWVYSRHSRHGTNMIKLAFRWFKANFRMKQYLLRQNFEFMNVGYEELSLYPDVLLKRICDFIGIKYNPSFATFLRRGIILFGPKS